MKLKKTFKGILFFLLLTIIFSFTYRQAPLYQSNQNTKFLHGLAQAGYGFLKNDWLANTIDPLPAFSFIVFLTQKFLNEYFFYFYYMLILGLFIYTVLKIIINIFEFEDSPVKQFLFFTIIITLHSTLLNIYYSKIFNYKITELLMEQGVAKQYLLGSYFQPCVFGVFILLSIYVFLKNKTYLAVLFLAIASIFHSVYLFSSGIITLSYMIMTYMDKKDLKKVLLIGSFSLILVLPIIIYNFIYLGPTSKDATNEALHILVNERIPKHSLITMWFDFDAFLKIFIISIAVFLVRKKRIFLILLIPFVFAVLLTLIQLFLNIDFINFITPWRVTVWLVPLSTCIIAGYLVKLIFDKIKNIKLNMVEISINVICIFIILMHLVYGINGTIKQFSEYKNKDHGELMNYVNKNKKQGDIYLVPPGMMEFRLNTGVPILVSEKSHPYKDFEFLEWNERLTKAKNFYNSNTNIDEKIMIFKKDYNITHVILTKKQFDFSSEYLEELYKDNNNGVYRIKITSEN